MNLLNNLSYYRNNNVFKIIIKVLMFVGIFNKTNNPLIHILRPLETEFIHAILTRSTYILLEAKALSCNLWKTIK